MMYNVNIITGKKCLYLNSEMFSMLLYIGLRAYTHGKKNTWPR